jgi:acyl carrier protein
MNIELIQQVVIDNLNALIETLPDDQKFVVDLNTILFGQGSQIDSLSLVSVIVDLETTLSVDYDLDISLTDDRAMNRTISPFDSVRNMVDYIDELVKEKTA